ncbi:MAG TPA: YihY family inner membrane protein [Usitatibacter sp.]|nr:YihY family inner membrane protein [Usitatibacter sp.]
MNSLAKRPSIRLLLDAWGFLRFVIRRWSEDRCPQIAGSLAYTSLLALVPMFAVAVAMLSATPLFGDAVAKIKIFLLHNLMPDIAAKIITVSMEEVSARAARLTGVGLAALFVIAVTQLMIMERSLNAIWRVQRSRPYWISVLGYVALLLTGPLLIGVSVSITTYIVSISRGVAPSGHALLLRAVPAAMTAVAFFLIYRIIPHRQVPWRHALLGGAIAAVMFEAAKELFAFYVRLAPTYHMVYGAFAAVPIFLLWVYLSWVVVLFGAELTASFDYWRGGLWRRAQSAGLRFRDAVLITRFLVESGSEGIALERLRREAGIAGHELEDTLARLMDGGMVRRVRHGVYALAADPAEITLGDLYRLAVGPLGGMRPEDWTDLSPDFVRAAAEMQVGLGRPIATLGAAAAARAQEGEK